MTRARLARQLRRRVLFVGHLVNYGGAALLTVYLIFIFPPSGAEGGWLSVELSLILAGVYVVIAGVNAVKTGWRRVRPAFEWLSSEEPPTPEQRHVALRIPWIMTRITVERWLLAAPIFGVLGLSFSVSIALEIVTTIALSALTIAAAEFWWSSACCARRCPTRSKAPRCRTPRSTVGRRLFLAWLLCSAVPVVMLSLIPIGRDVSDPDDLIAPIWFVAGCALLAGFLATKLAVQRVSTPLRQLRNAVQAVGEGDLEVKVAVDDASEVGRLQAGFNEMVAGLREREQLRDLYGRQVGVEVARQALEDGTDLGGRTQVVSVMFVDVVGSTRLASRERPERVVELLNGFFALVVAVVERHGGFVNKFEGDAALSIFGAPVEQPDHAARALACARELGAALTARGGLQAAIGVSCGEAVAGWVGAESRFEYTVIGDPINEASRLTELAKETPSRTLASMTTVDAAGPPESALWEDCGEALLRGRDQPTRLAVPVGSGELIVLGRRGDVAAEPADQARRKRA